MKRVHRLTRSIDFQRVRRSGKSFAHPLLILMASPNHQPNTRAGISVSRAVGNAVKRNWAKRRIRACLDEVLDSLSDGWDLVFLARRPILDADYSEIRSAVLAALRRAGLLEENNGP